MNIRPVKIPIVMALCRLAQRPSFFGLPWDKSFTGDVFEHPDPAVDIFQRGAKQNAGILCPDLLASNLQVFALSLLPFASHSLPAEFPPDRREVRGRRTRGEGAELKGETRKGEADSAGVGRPGSFGCGKECLCASKRRKPVAEANRTSSVYKVGGSSQYGG